MVMDGISIGRRTRVSSCQPLAPSMAAASNAAFQPYVDSSVAVLAFVLAVTNILCPFMVKFILTKHPADEPAAAK